MDLVIKNGRIVTPSGIISAGIAVNNGKIAAIAGEDFLPTADKTIDATSKYILPGLIDPHTHASFNFVVPFESTVQSETKAAALGGVTTVAIYMRLVKTGILAPFDQYKGNFEANAVVDGFFHNNVSNEISLEEIPRSPDFGITGFKFINYGAQSEALGVPRIDDGFVCEGLKRISKLGYPARAMFHAENADIIAWRRKELEHRQDVRVWHDSRPNFVEEEAMHRYLFLAEVAKCPLYIVHITIREGVDIIHQAKAEGIDVIAETCPQYLTHNSEEPVAVIKENPTYAVVNPPLRGKEDNERLWQGIRDSVIDCIGSDQAPASKERKGTDMWKAIMGVGNITQMILPVMLSEGVNKNRISLEKVTEVCSQNPAQVFGLYPRKGSISVGSDADMVIVDLDKKVKFTPQMSPSYCDWSIYEGWEFKGWPICTILRGKVVAEDGKIVVEPGLGRYLFR